jgi:hypothetical protein
MKINKRVEQGSEEWLQLRKGRATASEFSKILTPTGKISKSAVSYMRKLARECVVDDPLEFMGNKFTDWGNANEPWARDQFRLETGLDVVEVGFCTRDDLLVGCSPDGLIRDPDTGEWIGGLEIKCPSVDKHVEYLMKNELPSDYKMQVHGSMAVTGLPWWYFMSYFPGLNPLILKVERDDFTESVSVALDQFVIDYAEERERVFDAILPSRQKHQQ